MINDYDIGNNRDFERGRRSRRWESELIDQNHDDIADVRRDVNYLKRDVRNLHHKRRSPSSKEIIACILLIIFTGVIGIIYFFYLLLKYI